MITANYNISFDFAGDNGNLKVRLLAEVEVHHSIPYYIIKNFSRPGKSGNSLLPEIRLKKTHGQWVHVDSGKASDLSLSVGLAIDAYEQSQKEKEAS